MTTIRIPYFDGVEVELIEDYDPDEPAAVAALEAFLALGPDDRVADSRHVFAYYADFREEVGEGGWLDDEMGVPATPADIWEHVTLGSVDVAKGRDGDDNWYVVMNADCAWEEEHGLMLVWRNGKTLSKVGGYDGHLTNHNRYADPGFAAVVYHAMRPEYQTRLMEDGG